MKMLCFFLLLPGFWTPSRAQAQAEDKWDTYAARFDKGTGSVMLDMDLKSRAPLADYPYLLIVVTHYKDCLANGLPERDEFANLYNIDDSVQACLNRIVRNVAAGTFTYQCQRRDYYYLPDTAGVRQALSTQMGPTAHLFAEHGFEVVIHSDPEWNGYLKFLYPSDLTYEYMLNQKIIGKLIEKGDSLDKARPVDHFLYFTTPMDRDRFVAFCGLHGFDVVSSDSTGLQDRTYSLHIVRTDKVDLESISELTLTLRKEAARCNGIYDGWETYVVKGR